MGAREEIVAAIQSAERFCLITHENPDGDALGSLVGMHLALVELGKDSMMLAAEREFPLAPEYRVFENRGIQTEPPQDVKDRTVIFLDCGSIDRSPFAGVKDVAATVLNIDHHHDNTLFGTVNLVVGDASCTGEIVWQLMNDLGVEMTGEIAGALYVALVTDTGRFMYENTGVNAHTMAGELIAAGVDVQAIYRQLYEEMPYSRLRLLEHALRGVRRYDDGVLTMAAISLEDFRSAEAKENDSEGVVDHLRAVEGTKVAAMSRELGPSANGGSPPKKVSLRSTDGSIDVSVIARGQGGGGHRAAAGFSTDLSDDELVKFLREQIAAQL